MRLASVVLGLMLLFACSKDKDNQVPNVYVNYQVTVQEFGIKNKNGVLLVNGHGVAGLLIYKNAGYYLAYDRCSTVNPEKRCPVIPDEGGLTATDTCSGAKYSLFDGAPMKAPAKRNLKQYSVTIINNSLIQVSN